MSHSSSSPDTHVFYQRTFGMGAGLMLVLGCISVGAGVLQIVLSDEDRYGGIRWLVMGAILLQIGRCVKLPFFIIDVGSIQMRRGASRAYQVIKRVDLTGVDIQEKKITFRFREGKPLDLPRWIIRKEDWARLVSVASRII